MKYEYIFCTFRMLLSGVFTCTVHVDGKYAIGYDFAVDFIQNAAKTSKQTLRIALLSVVRFLSFEVRIPKKTTNLGECLTLCKCVTSVAVSALAASLTAFSILSKASTLSDGNCSIREKLRLSLAAFVSYIRILRNESSCE